MWGPVDGEAWRNYENVFQWGFARRSLFARNWKVQGSWDGGAPILNNYPIECEAKPLEELVIEDAGEGIGFMILAVTAEVAGAVTEEPVLDVSFHRAGRIEEPLAGRVGFRLAEPDGRACGEQRRRLRRCGDVADGAG